MSSVFTLQQLFGQKKSTYCLTCSLKADDRIRTDDLRITNALLYRLSHIGLCCEMSAQRTELLATRERPAEAVGRVRLASHTVFTPFKRTSRQCFQLNHSTDPRSKRCRGRVNHSGNITLSYYTLPLFIFKLLLL